MTELEEGGLASSRSAGAEATAATGDAIGPPRRWPWLASLLALLVVALIYRDFGTTMDESVQDVYGRLCLRWFATGFSDGAHARFLDLRVYGPLVEMFLVLVEGGARVSYAARHLGVGLIAVLSIPALAWFCRPLGRSWVGPVAVVALWTSPQFLGHAFNNSKDLPFLVAFVAFMAAILNALVSDRPRFSRAAAVGVTAGLALAVRPGGIFALAASAALVVALAVVLRVGWLTSSSSRRWLRVIALTALATVLAWIVMVAAWPWALGAPLSRPITAILAATRFPRVLPVLFDCRFRDSTALPWYYLAKCILIVTPLAHLLAAAGSIPTLHALLRRGERTAALCLSVSLGWLLLPIAAFAIVRPTAYDGMRHFLFTLPALALLVGFTLAELARRLSRWRPTAAAAAVALLLLPPVVADVRMHPYECSWFNALVGGLRGAANCYEVDYWGSGVQEAVTWIARHGRVGSIGRTTVLVSSTIERGVPLDLDVLAEEGSAGAVLDVVEMSELPLLARSGRGIDYYVGIRRWGLMNLFADAKRVSAVKRDGVTLVVVRDLGGAPIGRQPAPGR